MLIAQISDLHLGFGGPDTEDKNTERFKDILYNLESLSVKPDLLLLTGDLVEIGNNWAYSRVRELCDTLDIPTYCAMGNHDDRSVFEDIFKTRLFENGFLNYVIDDFDLRIIVVDTLEPGRHGAGFCKTREDWLAKHLAEQPYRPTLIVMHHPPIETGIGWLTASPEDDWVKRFSKAISGHNNIVQIIAGHIHRNMFQRFQDTVVSVSHAVAPSVSLDLRPVDPETPDGRVLLSDATGGYCLHHWNGGVLTTHIIHVPTGEPIVKYDEDHAWIVNHTLDLN